MEENAYLIVELAPSDVEIMACFTYSGAGHSVVQTNYTFISHSLNSILEQKIHTRVPMIIPSAPIIGEERNVSLCLNEQIILSLDCASLNRIIH
jgi:hypothetical protein